MIWNILGILYLLGAFGVLIISLYAKTPKQVRPHERLIAAFGASVLWPVAVVGIFLWPATDDASATTDDEPTTTAQVTIVAPIDKKKKRTEVKR